MVHTRFVGLDIHKDRTMSVGDANSKGDYATTFRPARQLADRGDAVTQNNLDAMSALGTRCMTELR